MKMNGKAEQGAALSQGHKKIILYATSWTGWTGSDHVNLL